MNMWKL